MARGSGSRGSKKRTITSAARSRAAARFRAACSLREHRCVRPQHGCRSHARGRCRCAGRRRGRGPSLRRAGSAGRSARSRPYLLRLWVPSVGVAAGVASRSRVLWCYVVVLARVSSSLRSRSMSIVFMICCRSTGVGASSFRWRCSSIFSSMIVVRLSRPGMFTGDSPLTVERLDLTGGRRGVRVRVVRQVRGIAHLLPESWSQRRSLGCP